MYTQIPMISIQVPFKNLGETLIKNMFCQASLKLPSRYKYRYMYLYMYMPGTQCSINFQPTTSSNLFPTLLFKVLFPKKKSSNLDLESHNRKRTLSPSHYHHHLLQTFHRIQKVLLLTGFEKTFRPMLIVSLDIGDKLTKLYHTYTHTKIYRGAFFPDVRTNYTHFHYIG